MEEVPDMGIQGMKCVVPKHPVEGEKTSLARGLLS